MPPEEEGAQLRLPGAVAQAHRDRADTENLFDELKNQRGLDQRLAQSLSRQCGAVSQASPLAGPVAPNLPPFLPVRACSHPSNGPSGPLQLPNLG